MIDGKTSSLLPPAGPAWFPSVMGIGVAANLLQAYWHQRVLAMGLLVVCWVVLVGLSAGFVLRCLRSRRVFWASVAPVDEVPMWGAVAMALLTAGSATSTVLPASWPGATTLAWRTDLVLWVLGTFVGLVSTVAFTLRLLGRDCGRPAVVWGLAVVAPMVSATSGALLAPHVPSGGRVGMLAASSACFCTALFMGWAVFAGACHHAWRVEPLAVGVRCTSWIPVALVGQSVAAMQAIARQLVAMAKSPYDLQVQQVANGFSWVVLVVGVPLVVWAATETVRGFLGRMPFNPSWWALTFPMGSMALGSHLFAAGEGARALEWAGHAWTVALCSAVGVCALATVLAVVARRGPGVG